MHPPRTVSVNGKAYSLEVAEMMREAHHGHAMSINDQYWYNITYEILDDMRHPLRHNERFVLAFARRLARVVTARIEL